MDLVLHCSSPTWNAIKVLCGPAGAILRLPIELIVASGKQARDRCSQQAQQRSVKLTALTCLRARIKIDRHPHSVMLRHTGILRLKFCRFLTQFFHLLQQLQVLCLEHMNLQALQQMLALGIVGRTGPKSCRAQPGGIVCTWVSASSFNSSLLIAAVPLAPADSSTSKEEPAYDLDCSSICFARSVFCFINQSNAGRGN